MHISDTGLSMTTVISITLLFVAGTSLLGGVQSWKRAQVSRELTSLLGAIVGFVMTAWCAFLGVWVLVHDTV